MKKNEFFNQYKDPRWQKKRLEILERDQFICQMCTDDENELHVHHKYYTKDAKPWDYPDDAYVTLCESCHKEYHSLMESGKELLYSEHPMFLGEYLDLIKVIKRFNPAQMMYLKDFISKMFPLSSDNTFYE